MEFRILGPLEVEDAGRVLPLHGGRQRALLALLLLNAGEVVSVDRLLHELWGAEQPRSGATAVRVRVAELRKALGGTRDGPKPPIVTAAPGYAIRVDPDRIDARRFERLLREGGDAFRTGAAELAASTLRAALGLWRGPALADLADEPFARPEAARLDELRLCAREELIEAELALGRDAELVAELEALVAAEPLRERPRAQLMLALYRSGRPADALSAYRETRRVFVEELGIEPSPALLELERAILRHDPSLERGGRPARAAASVARERLPTGELKLATVIACRLACRRVAPARGDCEDEALAGAAEAVAVEIEEAGGRIESLSPDDLVAVFGAPVAREDHAGRALETALAIRRRVERGFGKGVSLGVGVATGDVVVTESGEGGSSLAGGALAVARALAEAAAEHTILVGERTVTAARAPFDCGPPVAFEATDGPALAGRPLLGRLEGGPHGEGPRTPFVGRERELATLQSAYRRAADGSRPQLATIVGDAGVGKTRIARELWAWLGEASPRPLRRSGRCVQRGRATTYSPLADVLREELGLLETDSPETVRAALGERLVLGMTLGLEVADLHPIAARERLHRGWVELLTELTARSPLVLLVEDLHWAQEPLLALLERMLHDVDAPLLIVATARPELLETRPSWGRRRDADTVWLEPLAGPDAGRMLDCLGAAELPERVRQSLLARAEGNPFFLEELVASLVDQGVLTPKPAALRTATPRGASELLPDTVQAVLAARIDLLPDVEKAALQAAALIGRAFWREPVCELIGGARPDFAMLEARDFIRRGAAAALAGEWEYAFKHALTRDVAYSSLPHERRARLHAAFADWLEQVGEGRDEHASLLAHHYAESVSRGHADPAWEARPAEYERTRRKALTWLRRAAELAVSRYEIDDGVALLEHALELEGRARARVGLWRALGRAYALKYDGERFWHAMRRAIELCSDRSTLAELYAELAFETSGRAGMWRRRPDRELVDGWIAQALELADADTPARTKALLALAYWNPEGAGEASREALDIAERLDDPELRSYAYDARAISLFVRGRLDLGYGLEKRRFELLDRITDPEHVADIHYAPITASVWRGDFEEARYLARRHDEISSGLTPHHRIHGIAVLLEVEELAGDWNTIGELQALAERRVAEDADTPCVRNARSLLVCALASTHLGRDADARRLEAAAEEMRMEGFGHVLDTPRLRLALARGELERVERLLREPLPDRGWHRGWLLISTHAARLDGLAAVGRRRELEAWPPPEPKSYLEPFLLRALGIVRADADLLGQALAGFEALRLDWHAAETRALVDRVTRPLPPRSTMPA